MEEIASMGKRTNNQDMEPGKSRKKAQEQMVLKRNDEEKR